MKIWVQQKKHETTPKIGLYTGRTIVEETEEGPLGCRGRS